MPRELRLSRTARSRIVAIASWTVDRFGAAQAVRYRDGLIALLDDLANGRGQRRSLQALTGQPEHADYETAKYGRHIVVFKRTETTIIVIDILHDAQDLTAFDT